MDEFSFDQNVSFITASAKQFEESLRNATQRSKARQIDVFIHSGADEAESQGAYNMLDNLIRMVEYARSQKNVKLVSVCSVEERWDVGRTVYENIKTVNAELAQLCSTTGCTFIDLRPRFNESLYGGINRTGVLYTFEGARNVAQHILSETAGFLD